jgi:hypothetical protein
MSINIKIINPLKDLTWDKKVHDLSNSAFYTSYWAEVVSSTYGYKPLYFALEKDDKIVSYIPIMEINHLITGKKGVSLPFSDICEPYAYSKYEFNSLFEYIKEYGKQNNWHSIELRGGSKFLDYAKNLSSYYEHVLDFRKPINEIYNGFKESVKRNIKKSQSFGIKIITEPSIESLKSFIKLNKITRKRHGLPSQPKNFFYNLYNKIIVKGQGYIISAKMDNKIIASFVFLTCNNEVIYKYGASNLKYQKYRVNNFLMWEAIKFFKEKNFDLFSFGRTFPDNKGLMQFKEGWSSNINLINYYKYNLKKDVFVVDKDPEKSFINVFFKNIPVFASSMLGNLLYKYFL